MSLKGFYLFLYLAIFSTFCHCENEEEEEYSDDYIDQKVSKLRLEGAQYLQKVMAQLQNDRTQTQIIEVPEFPSALYTQRVYELDHEIENYVTPVYNISGPTPVTDLVAEIVRKPPPPVSLSKEELLALYKAALGKVQVELPPIQGETQTEDTTPLLPSNLPEVKPAIQGQMGNSVSGYYYYYFPITNFLKSTTKPQTIAPANTTPAPQHLHATITMMESPNNKSMEPLFMAISGFIGMALMFFFSVLFVPKFGKIRSKNAQFKDTPDEMANFAQIVLEAMAGKDCTERLACEIARVFRGLKSNNKPLRVLEIILPPNMAQKISLIRKSAGKRAKCSYIACKMKKAKPPATKPQKPKVSVWKKKESPHDLWMKHFEKGKWKNKQEQQKQNRTKTNGWNRKPPSKKT